MRLIDNGAPVFSDSKEMRAHYAQVRGRIMALAPPMVPPESDPAPLPDPEPTRMLPMLVSTPLAYVKERPAAQTVAIIFGAVCLLFNVSREGIHSVRRNYIARRPRWVVVVALNRLLPQLSTSQIGNHFGMDHSSIMHIIRRTDEVTRDISPLSLTMAEYLGMLATAIRSLEDINRPKFNSRSPRDRKPNAEPEARNG